MNNKEQALTHERLKEILKYCPSTGFFTHRLTRGRCKAGDVAGGPDCREGYWLVCVNGVRYRAHRLAWFYMEGYWPESEIDHIDRNRSNNKWENLRHVSRQCNARNSGMLKNNTSGIKGVSWVKNCKRWGAKIAVLGKKYNLGYFKTKAEAAMARWEAEVEHNFPNCNTTSSAYQYLKTKGLTR